MHYAYPCILVAEDQGGFSVYYPDLPEALTCGDDRHSALEMAEDALVVALSARISDRERIPVPSAVLLGHDSVVVPPLLAAKLALHTAMQNQGIAEVDLASRMGVSDSVVRKLLDPRTSFPYRQYRGSPSTRRPQPRRCRPSCTPHRAGQGLAVHDREISVHAMLDMVSV